ncbi:MAG: hypothetical protein WA474_10915 [Candidatus Sulfotelmatobacter sp.]
MSARRLAKLASLILIPFHIAAFADDTELAVAKVHEGVLDAGKSRSFSVSLNAGDFARIKVDPRGKQISLIAYDPSDRRYRGTTFGPDEGKFNFIAESAGRYRVEVAAVDKTVTGAYTITLEKVVSLPVRLALTKPEESTDRQRVSTMT